MKTKQKGMMTLFTTVMLLLLITLNVFIGAKGSVMDQKIANNQYRSEEAAQNADAGVSQLVSNLKTYVTENPNASDVETVKAAAIVSRYSAVYDSATGVITSVGYGSGNAIKTVTQRVVFTAGGGGGPAALNALGNITLGGNASATSVKAGGSVTTTGSGSISTPGGANTPEFKVALLDHNGNALKDANGVAILRSMTSEEYFMHFFGGFCPTAKAANNANACEAETKATIIADTAKGYYCASNCGALNDSTLLRCNPIWF